MSILNSLTANPVAIYSLRKLKDNYVGYAICVRRSTDSIEQDIGFDGSGNLDTTALTTFIGSNTGYIVLFYDQSGNGNDLMQTTLSNQPRIVNAGTLDVSNAKPAIYFNGSYKLVSLNALPQSNDVTINNVFTPNATQNGYAEPFGNYNGLTNGGFMLEQDAGNNNKYYFAYSTGTTYQGVTIISGALGSTQQVFDVVKNSTTITMYKNGTQNVAGTTTTATIASATTKFYIGIAKPSSGINWQGNYQGIIIFNSALSDTDRRYLETNQGDYYGITVANPLYPPTGSITITPSVGSAIANTTSPIIMARQHVAITPTVANSTADTTTATVIARRHIIITPTVGAATADETTPTVIGRTGITINPTVGVSIVNETTPIITVKQKVVINPMVGNSIANNTFATINHETDNTIINGRKQLGLGLGF